MRVSFRGLPIRSGMARTDSADELVFRSAGMPQYPLPFLLTLKGDPEVRARVNAERYEAAERGTGPGIHACGIATADGEIVLR